MGGGRSCGGKEEFSQSLSDGDTNGVTLRGGYKIIGGSGM